MTEHDWKKLLDQVLRIEDVGLAPFRDAEGNLIVARKQYLDAVGLSGTNMTILESDLRLVGRELEERWPMATKFDSVRRRVLIHMAFSMGIRGLLAISRFISTVEVGLWDVAADEMAISQWAKQSPQRAMTLANMMRTGRDDA